MCTNRHPASFGDVSTVLKSSNARVFSIQVRFKTTFWKLHLGKFRKAAKSRMLSLLSMCLAFPFVLTELRILRQTLIADLHAYLQISCTMIDSRHVKAPQPLPTPTPVDCFQFCMNVIRIFFFFGFVGRKGITVLNFSFEEFCNGDE